MVFRMIDPQLWCIFPTASPADVVARRLEQWRELGWSTAILVDGPRAAMECAAELVVRLPRSESYPGWARSMNMLAREALARGAELLACMGDDLEPGPDMQAAHVRARWAAWFGDSTFGVLQPMGDAWNQPKNNRPIAVSPIVGAEFVRRTYRGDGPFFPGDAHDYYRHLHADSELSDVAHALRRYHGDRELTVHHRHHARGCPDTLDRAARAAIGWSISVVVPRASRARSPLAGRSRSRPCRSRSRGTPGGSWRAPSPGPRYDRSPER